MIKIFKIGKSQIIIVLSLAILIGLTWYNGGRWFSISQSSYISPKGYYRVKIIYHPWDIGYGYADLYDNQSGKLLVKSQKYPIDDNSSITWTSECHGKPSIDIGMNVCFQITPEPAQPCCKVGQAIIPLQAKAIYIEN